MDFKEPKPWPVRSSGKAIASFVLGLLSSCLTVFTGIPAIILGAWALADISQSGGRLRGQGLAIAGLVFGVMGLAWTCLLPALLLPAVQAAREAARRVQSSNNLKTIGLGMHNYHDAYKSLPLAGSTDPQHGVGLSWRVRLLPFIEKGSMYDEVNWQEPWDGPQNRALLQQMPPEYRSPNQPAADSTKTIYQAVVSPRPPSEPFNDAVFSHDPPFASRFADITDGTANTILAVEADAELAVPWTKPADWQFDPQDPRRGLGNLRPGGFLALFADGSVQFIGNDTDPAVLRGLFSRNDASGR